MLGELDGRYEILERIGSGGMAKVYRARDSRLDREVAVKVMRGELSRDASFVERFKNEARAAAQLGNPHVVAVHDWGQDGQRCFIVMELVRGVDLKTAVRENGPFGPARVAEIGIQICAALQEAHGRAIVHRDIKSSNLMMEPSGNVKVMDFGISETGRDRQRAGEGLVLGTAHYMSPEHVAGKGVGPRSDLYSLGVVMYELSSGCLPFTADTTDEVMSLQTCAEPIGPHLLAPDLDLDLEAIILKALAKRPADRFASAGEMAGALEGYLAAESHRPNGEAFPSFWVGGIVRGPASLRGTMFRIDGPCAVGRGLEADVRIGEPAVSSRHVRLVPRGAYLEVEDLKSSNGTLVDGKPLRRKTLCQPGANIDIGNVRIRIGAKR